MNFLFHMLLSGDDDQLLIGNFMGDFVKGSLRDRFPHRIKSVADHGRIYLETLAETDAER